MTIHAGVFHFDRRPTAWHSGCAHCAEGIVMMQPEPLWAGSVSVASSASVRGPLVATWDGRLDNRADVLAALGRDDDALLHASDGDIALAVFSRWTSDGLRMLVGDWSMAVWDASIRTLHLARDYMGGRPLYYAVDAAGAAWSSDLADLIVRAGRREDLSDRFAADFMMLRISPEVTPYEGVHAVPPGTCVSIHADGRISQSRFWDVQMNDVRYGCRRDYEEHLRALWREAVQTRLRTEGTVWAEISGGLDSSAVVCMADLLIRAGDTSTRGIRLVSHATLRSPEGDERRFIAEVERQVGVTSEIIGVEDHQDRADPDLAWVTPHARQGVGLATVQCVRAAGGRVVLSGRLGDAVMGCQPDNSAAVFDDFRRGALIGALAKMRLWSRATRKPLLEIACTLWAPEAHGSAPSGAELLTDRLRQAGGPPVAEAFRVRRSKRGLASMILAYSRGARFDVPYQSPEVTYTYPFTHRPLVDFMLAIPGEELSEPGTTRSLMRRSFASFMPPRVIARVSKGYYPPAAFRAARRLALSLVAVRELEVVQRGWIDPDRLQHAVRCLTDGGAETGGDIHGVLRLESWLEARRTMPHIPRRKEVNTNAVLHA